MNGEFAITLVIMVILMSFLPSLIYAYAKNESDDNRLKDQTIRTEGSKTVKIKLNGQDEENKLLKFYIVKFPSNGRISGTVPNITYTPNLGYHGVDNLTYGMSNGTIESNVATITIEVKSALQSYFVIIVILLAIFIGLFLAMYIHYETALPHYETALPHWKSEPRWIEAVDVHDQNKENYTKEITKASQDSMTKSKKSDSPDVKEILKKEYDRYSDLFKENESLGERRVSFFMTLITTIISALGITTVATNLLSGGQVGAGNIFLPIVFFILIGLFLFGIVTYRRIIGRNVTTDNYLVNLDEIRISLADIPPPKPVLSREKSLRSMIFSVGKGGLGETIRAINSLIVGLICTVPWIYILGLNLFTVIPFIIGFVGSWIDQCLFAKMTYLDEEKGKIRVRKEK